MTRTITHLYDDYEEATRAVRMLENEGIPPADISIVAQDRRDAGGTAATDPIYAGRAGVPAIDARSVDARSVDARSVDAPALETPARETSALDDTPVLHTAADESASTGAGAGASVGTIIGGGVGLLAGIGALAIPGVGPVVAAGWLVATITGAGVGAGAGGLLGSLTGAGHREEEAHVYAEGVRRGGTLVSVRADDVQEQRVEMLLNGTGRVDIAQRGAEYRDAGWDRFDETRPGAPAAAPDSLGATPLGTSGAPLSPEDVERQRLRNSTHG